MNPQDEAVVTFLRKKKHIPLLADLPVGWVHPYKGFVPFSGSYEAALRAAGHAVRVGRWQRTEIVEALADFYDRYDRWPRSSWEQGAYPNHYHAAHTDFQPANGLPNEELYKSQSSGLQAAAYEVLYQRHPERRPSAFSTREAALDAIVQWMMDRWKTESDGIELPGYRDFQDGKAVPGIPNWRALRAVGITGIDQLRQELIERVLVLDADNPRTRGISLDRRRMTWLTEQETADLRTLGAQQPKGRETRGRREGLT